MAASKSLPRLPSVRGSTTTVHDREPKHSLLTMSTATRRNVTGSLWPSCSSASDDEQGVLANQRYHKLNAQTGSKQLVAQQVLATAALRMHAMSKNETKKGWTT